MLKDEQQLLSALSEAKLSSRYVLIHGKTVEGKSATMTLGRCFQSEPEVLMLGFDAELAKSQVKDTIQILGQTFGTPKRIEDSSGNSLVCQELALKDWLCSEHRLEKAVGFLLQSIPLEQLKDFLEFSQVLVFSQSEDWMPIR